ncbi:ABC transporter, ATP-binding protein [Dictyocaulus viviparus]|uniref:ABC transporter, ATP-binding protein n=1 Tax=Dictyocaulus viviparus TaxID=29172 RepID=A0A0D8XEJ3_DICVI|nr:ABC transporter, ATP-binding protein [Dictyocaulus viviparus]
MANLEAIPEYLAVTFPTLPAEINDYISSILKENVDEILTLDDVVGAVGDHLQLVVVKLFIVLCERTMYRWFKSNVHEVTTISSWRVMNINIFINLPKLEEHGITTKKLDQAVDMAAEHHNFAEMESIWKLQARDAPTSVDKKKLGKAENRAAQKAEQRLAEPIVRKKRPESTATASQAPVKDLGNRGANLKDVKLESIDISIGTKQLLSSADLTLAYGRRYGLVGRNGIGKTTLLKMISSGQLQIPSGINLLAVEQEVEGDDTKVIDSVLSSDTRRQAIIEKERVLQSRLNKDNLSEVEKNRWNEELSKLYCEMGNLQLDKAPARAASILYGLGFTPDEQKKPTKEFSGGWRMRVALARALFIKPDLLLLDEPTNMLDMRAVYWLEGHLQQWEGTILTVSHDRKFLNEICTDIVHLHTRRLDHYRGNYNNFEKTMKEKLIQQQREYEAQQTLRQHTQEFIDKFRYNAKRAAMVQSRIKMLEKLPILHPVELDADITFKFPECEMLNNPVLQLDDTSFRYSEDAPFLFRKLNLGTHANSRICIVGENGSGKTTLLKLLLGELNPTVGIRNVNRRIRIGYFTQHHVDQLDMDMTAIEVLAHRYPGRSQEEYRTALSHFGLVGDMALQSVYTLSGGQKSRLAFANIAMLKPNYLILDEPTNHLDVETVAALGMALNSFSGGVVLVSHDEQLIEMVCKELWVVKDRMVVNLEGGLEEYRKQVYKQLQLIS